MKFIPVFILSLLLGACAQTNQSTLYKVGEYDVHIADFQTVNQEWKKIPGAVEHWNAPQVNGFINYLKKEIWSIDKISTLIHEFKHLHEGHFHNHEAARGSSLDAMKTGF